MLEITWEFIVSPTHLHELFSLVLDVVYVFRIFRLGNGHTLFAYWVNLHAFLWSADFFKILLFDKFIQEYHPSVK